MSQNPLVHFDGLIYADRVDKAETLSSCQLPASAHLHYTQTRYINTNNRIHYEYYEQSRPQTWAKAHFN